MKYIRKDNLPDGKLYWNIAERIITSLLSDIYEEVNRVAFTVQAKDDEANKINIKPQKAPFPNNKIRDLVDKSIEIYDQECSNG